MGHNLYKYIPYVDYRLKDNKFSTRFRNSMLGSIPQSESWPTSRQGPTDMETECFEST